nr:DNA helicase [Tanacetum cinerariifolium]
MRRKHENKFENAGLNEFQKQRGNILNHVETLATFDGLDNLLGGSGPGWDVPFAGASLVMINRAEDAQLYLDVYRKYSRVSGKVSCVQQDTGSSPFIGGIPDSLDKRKLQPSVSSLCGSSASLPGRSSHVNTNAVMINGDSQNSSPVSRRGGNTQENSQLRNVQLRPRLNSEVFVRSTSRRNDRRVLTSGGTVDTNSVASAGHLRNRTPEYNLCCRGGRIQMQRPREPLEYIKSLFENKHFMKNIRPYNQMFAMMSFEAKVDESINAERGPYVFKVSDQIYHWVGSLCSPAGKRPSFFEQQETMQRTRDSRVQNTTLQRQRGGRLFQQYVVGVFYTVEQNRLDFIRKKQNDIRSDYLSRLYDAISRGEREGYEVGGRIILPMSFIGCPRYIYAHYLDALSIFQKLGNPQFFITFTCNVSWPEIKRFMSEYPHLTAYDRADVVCRVFDQKIQALIAFLKEERIFGDVTRASKIKIIEDVDRFVLAELPDPRTDPEGYNVVSELMMHGPCGAASCKAPCMKDDKCNKKFLKNSIRRPLMKMVMCIIEEETRIAACQALCLLGDDKEREIAFEEACGSAAPEELSGTGKTLLWKTIISSLRSEGKIVLAVASSGIASYFCRRVVPRILDSNFPLEQTEESLCRFTKNTQLRKLLANTDLIIWDEAPMNDRRCFDALDRSLRDIVDRPSSLFGRKSVLLGGDFRQTLAVKKHNMRLARPDISLEEQSLVNSFASWLLDVDDEKIGEPTDGDPENTSWVYVPPAYCLPSDKQGLSKLIDFICDQSTLYTPSAASLQQKAIVCPKNKTADIINSKVLDMVAGESTIYMSQDEATPTRNDGAETEMLIR